jgi:hypothetical protein
VEHNARSHRTGFGTLLGPEKTSAGWWLFFLVAAPGLDRLTHPVWAPCGVCGWVWWWLCGGWGVVVC